MTREEARKKRRALLTRQEREDLNAGEFLRLGYNRDRAREINATASCEAGGPQCRNTYGCNRCYAAHEDMMNRPA